MPTASAAAELTADAVVCPVAGGGDETILVVEDDASVRAFTVRALGDLGYTMLEADDARSALVVLGASPEIAMVLSDVVSPHGMSGVELCHRIQRHHPGIEMLLTSGYAEEVIAQKKRVADDIRPITKPYCGDALASEIRSMLDHDTQSMPGSIR